MERESVSPFDEIDNPSILILDDMVFVVIANGVAEAEANKVWPRSLCLYDNQEFRDFHGASIVESGNCYFAGAATFSLACGTRSRK